MGTRWNAKWLALDRLEHPHDGSSPEALLRASGEAREGGNALGDAWPRKAAKGAGLHRGAARTAGKSDGE